MKTYVMIIKFCLLFCLIGGMAACEKDQDTDASFQPKKIELTARGAEVIGNSNDFGVRLFSQLAADTHENIMISPLSASAALTMLLNGAEGETYTQIREMIGYPAALDIKGINEAYKSLVGQLLHVDPKVTLTLANAIFYRQDFDVKPPFIQAMDREFDAHIRPLNFANPSAVEVINQWASDQTRGRIPKVLEEIDPEMVMFLMNALYFKGDWTYQFDASQTFDGNFYLDNGEVITAPTMRGNKKTRRYAGSGFDVVELPYGQSNFSMVVVLPQSGLNEVHAGFSPALWKEITDGLDSESQFTETIVQMPRFTFDFDAMLNDPLKSLGMVNAFNEKLADLSGISDWDIFVSFVKQNTFVEVNEEGTEAAAVTTVGVGVTSVGPDQGPPFFIIDRPFVFAIRERTTNTLLFIGQLTNL